MTKDKKRKFALYLGTKSATRETILSETFRRKLESGSASKLAPRNASDEKFDAYYVESAPKSPSWMQDISERFDIEPKKKRTPAAIIVFEASDRIFAVTFGFGHSCLDERHIEQDFGIKVAVNTISDTKLKTLQKSNIANAIQQFAQSAFRSQFRAFGGQNKFEVLKRISGNSSHDDLDSVVGAAGLTATTAIKLPDLHQLADVALNLYSSTAYRSSQFAVIDDFRPVHHLEKVDQLDFALLDDVRRQPSSFELCIPQLNFEDNGYVKLKGHGLRGEFLDVSMDLYQSSLGDKLEVLSLEDLKNDRVCFFDDEHAPKGNWPVYRCLVGSIDLDDGKRYVLHEGQWFIPSDSISKTVEEFFSPRCLASDPVLGTFRAVGTKPKKSSTKNPKTIEVYESEEEFNKRISDSSDYILFDQQWHKSEDGSFSKLEVCDLYDPVNLRMIHVKRTSRRPAMVSYLFDQGLRGAQLWPQDDVRRQFIARVREVAGDEAADRLEGSKDDDITIEFAIADYVNGKGRYTIPFLGKLSFESKAREIERYGFRTVVRFIPLERPSKKSVSSHIEL